MPDDVHRLISTPPKHSISRVVRYMKGKSAIHVARHYLNQTKHTVRNTLVYTNPL